MSLKHFIISFYFVCLVFLSGCEKDNSFLEKYVGEYNFTIYYHKQWWSSTIGENFDTLNVNGIIRDFNANDLGYDIYYSNSDSLEDAETKLTFVVMEDIHINSVINSSGELIPKAEPFNSVPTAKYTHSGKFSGTDSVYLTYSYTNKYFLSTYVYTYTILGKKN